MGLLQGPFSSPIIPQRAAIDGLVPSSEQPSNGIPLRKFGRHDVKVSALEEGLRLRDESSHSDDDQRAFSLEAFLACQ